MSKEQEFYEQAGGQNPKHDPKGKVKNPAVFKGEANRYVKDKGRHQSQSTKASQNQVSVHN